MSPELVPFLNVPVRVCSLDVCAIVVLRIEEGDLVCSTVPLRLALADLRFARVAPFGPRELPWCPDVALEFGHAFLRVWHAPGDCAH